MSFILLLDHQLDSTSKWPVSMSTDYFLSAQIWLQNPGSTLILIPINISQGIAVPFAPRFQSASRIALDVTLLHRELPALYAGSVDVMVWSY